MESGLNPAERKLIEAIQQGYWAVSGYGLRASRSIGLLAAIIFIAAGLYTHPMFATMTPPPAREAAVGPLRPRRKLPIMPGFSRSFTVRTVANRLSARQIEIQRNIRDLTVA